jgi:hypothetical protein
LLPFKGLLRVIARLYPRPVRRFDYDADWGENGALVLAGEVHGEALIPRVGGQYYVLEEVSPAFDVPDGAGDRGRDFDRLHLIPSLETAVGSYSEIQ